MKDHLAYAKYVARHKWFVLQACRAVKVSALRGLAHDLSKLLPSEWFPYVHCFYTPDGSKQYNETPEFNLAWCLHQKRNPHHWQFWTVLMDRGEIVALEMPEKYVREMIADWIGAGRAITGKNEVASWYGKNWYKMILHPSTRMLVEELLEPFGFRTADRVEKPSSMQEDFFTLLSEAAVLCDNLGNVHDTSRCQDLAVHNVSWSDREIHVCERHIDYAKSAAANDGTGDRTNDPYIRDAYQSAMVLKWWPELIKRFTVDINGNLHRKNDGDPA